MSEVEDKLLEAIAAGIHDGKTEIEFGSSSHLMILDLAARGVISPEKFLEIFSGVSNLRVDLQRHIADLEQIGNMDSYHLMNDFVNMRLQ